MKLSKKALDNLGYFSKIVRDSFIRLGKITHLCSIIRLAVKILVWVGWWVGDRVCKVKIKSGPTEVEFVLS